MRREIHTRAETMICDRCCVEESQTAAYKVQIVFRGWRRVVNSLLNYSDTRELDLCPKCAAKFDSWMTARGEP